MSNKRSRNIFIIIGHPDKQALTGHLARWYREGAVNAGHRVRMLDLSTARFDPILHHGYSATQKLEPILKRAQRDITWAHHIVVVYPNWWGSMPAILKGFFDRVLLPGFAFTYDAKRMRSRGLLSRRSARIVLLLRVASKEYRKKYPYRGETVKHSIFEFCGIRPVKMTEIGPSERLPILSVNALRSQMRELGKKAA